MAGTLIQTVGSMAVAQPPRVPASFTRNAGGMPSAVKRLFLLTDGAAGAYGGPWADSSGNAGTAATLIAGSNPTRLANGGLSTNADGHGLAINWQFNITASFTYIVAHRSTMLKTDPQFAAWWQLSDVAFPASPSSSWPVTPVPYPNINSVDNTEGLLDPGADKIAVITSPITFPLQSRPVIPERDCPADQIHIAAWRVAGPNSMIAIDVLGATRSVGWFNNPGLLNYYGGFTSLKHVGGFHPQGTLRPCVGDLHAVAIADSLLTADAQLEAMTSLAAIVAARGYTVFGYQG